MATPAVSVIMPVYNAYLYVAKAIESVLQQTYQDFELILVDDGATDGSGEICEKYAAQDDRIVLIHEENGGICKARNAGLKHAQGTYIAFCDHDDLYMPQYLEKAVSSAIKENADLVKFAYRSEYSNDGQVTNVFEDPVPDAKLSVADVLQQPYELFDLTRRVLWNGLYKRDVIVNNRLQFDESILAGMEDFLFNIEYLSHISDVVYIPDKLFVHYCRSGQCTSSKYSENRMRNIVRVKHEELEFAISKMTGRAQSRFVVDHAYKYLSLMCLEFGYAGCSLNHREKKEQLKKHRQVDGGILSIKLFPEILNAARRWRGMAIQVALYACRCYSVLLWYWRLQGEKSGA